MRHVYLYIEVGTVPLREEDFSGVKLYVDQLRDSGITDFKACFQNHPEAVCARGKNQDRGGERSHVAIVRREGQRFAGENKDVVLRWTVAPGYER